MRILTWNVSFSRRTIGQYEKLSWAYRKDAIIDVLKKSNADIICLQEIHSDEKVNYIDIYTGDSNSVSEKIIPEKIEFQNSPPLKKELETFLEYLNGGDAPKSSLQEGILIVENILLLRKLAGLN